MISAALVFDLAITLSSTSGNAGVGDCDERRGPLLARVDADSTMIARVLGVDNSMTEAKMLSFCASLHSGSPSSSATAVAATLGRVVSRSFEGLKLKPRSCSSRSSRGLIDALRNASIQRFLSSKVSATSNMLRWSLGPTR